MLCNLFPCSCCKKRQELTSKQGINTVKGSLYFWRWSALLLFSSSSFTLSPCRSNASMMAPWYHINCKVQCSWPYMRVQGVLSPLSATKSSSLLIRGSRKWFTTPRERSARLAFFTRSHSWSELLWTYGRSLTRTHWCQFRWDHARMIRLGGHSSSDSSTCLERCCRLAPCSICKLQRRWRKRNM